MNPKTVQQQVKILEKRKVAKKARDVDFIRSVIFGLNSQLVALKLPLFGEGSGSSVDSSQISVQHRNAIRDDIRRQGTWIGHTELHVLATEFGVQLWLAIPEDDAWRRTQIGANGGHVIANPALCWVGNHYEVATLNHRGNDRYDRANVIATNEDGDCAFESFLTVLHVGQIRQSPRWPRFSGEQRILLRTFSVAYAVPRVLGLIPNNDVDYIEAIDTLRNMLAAALSDGHIDDAIIAMGSLPSVEGAKTQTKTKTLSVELGSGDWGRYLVHVATHFRLTRCLEFERFGSSRVYTVRNTDVDVPRLLQRAGRGGSVATILELDRTGRRVLRISDHDYKLTHLGFMVAKIETIGATYHLVCAFANFDVQYVDERLPYNFHGNDSALARKGKKPSFGQLGKKKPSGREVLFSAFDMHTECYSYFMLDRFIRLMKLQGIQRISCDFILQLDMCDRCREAQALFMTKHKALHDINVYCAESGHDVDDSLADEIVNPGSAGAADGLDGLFE